MSGRRKKDKGKKFEPGSGSLELLRKTIKDSFRRPAKGVGAQIPEKLAMALTADAKKKGRVVLDYKSIVNQAFINRVNAKNDAGAPPVHAAEINAAKKADINGGAANLAPEPGLAPIPIGGVYASFNVCRNSINGVTASIGGTCDTGKPITNAWRNTLHQFGTATDIALARGGDLIHDIGAAAIQPISNSPAAGNTSMIDFISAIMPGYAATLTGYIRSIPAILRDFNQFRLNSISSTQIRYERAALEAFTAQLLAQGVNHVCLDAQFGNLFSSGFGSGMTYIASTASEIDGASKVGSAKLQRAGLTFATDTTPFVFPDFYTGVAHKLERTGDLNTVEIAVGANNIKVSCPSGFSVNSLCQLLKIAPPRGTGEPGKPITIVSGTAIANHLHHIMMVKPMTDWAQIVYVFLLNMLGVRTVFITNDQYCLALAAAIGLPYIIRTPYAGSYTIEFYMCDPNFAPLSPADDAQIRAMFPIGPDASLQTLIDDWNYKIAKAIACMITYNIPPPIIELFRAEMKAVTVEMNTILTALRGAAPADISPYRALLNVTVTAFIKTKIEQATTSVAIRFASLGDRLFQQLHVNIKDDTDTIANVYYILNEYFSTQAEFMGVFNRLAGNDERISTRGTAPVGNWETYYRHYLAQVAPAYAATYVYDRPNGWDNQRDTLRRAMYTIAPHAILPPFGICADIAPPASNPTFQVGGAEDDDAARIAEDIMRMYKEHVTYVPNEYIKPSVSNGIEQMILNGFTDTDPVIRSAEIASVLEAMSTDGDETIGDLYRINVSSVRDMADAHKRGEISSADYATHVLIFIFYLAEFILDTLEYECRVKLLDAIVDLLEVASNLVIRDLESEAKATGSNMSKQLAIAERLRVRRTELGLYDDIPPVVTKKTGMFTIFDEPPSPMSPARPYVMLKLTSPPETQQKVGGARRRRTRRRGSRAAARRGRTFRRRK